ncbi:MAG TPA: hypothetical protein VH329_02860 [Solirubrobacterales bacterium]|jgi:hypothetical protein
MAEPQDVPPQLLEAIENLARFHREHEQFYSQAPLQQAREIQAASRALKVLATQWSEVAPAEHPAPNPMAGAEDLNPPGLAGETGILFMEGGGEPAEITDLKREIEEKAAGCEQTGEWLAAAMEQSWAIAGFLVEFDDLIDLLGERHRIIGNDWQAAAMNTLIARFLRRALDVLARIDFSPQALRADLDGLRRNPARLYTASELLDVAADLFARSSVLVHENERRWRIFGERVRELQARAG